MGDMAGLPALSDPRLIILQKQSKRMRKGIAIKNDKLRAHRDRVGRMEDKYKMSDQFRAWQRTLPYKHSLAEIRGLQKCLKKRRESSTLEPPPAVPAQPPSDSADEGAYDSLFSSTPPPPAQPAPTFPKNGVYDGATLDSMRRDVEQIIREKNPRERRLRKVEKIKSNGLVDGRILDPELAMTRFTTLINRPKGIQRNERDVSCRLSLDYAFKDRAIGGGARVFSPTCSTPSSQGALSIAGSPAPGSPAQFRLPPIQARRSTVANVATATRPAPSLYEMKSDRSDPSGRPIKRSMSFAVAR
ncbi:hypothetical protein PoB_005672400 [Plakobranchus ocellatus]|uniref:Uncharacterized protein n=1 Tax=Plakobranchus ocellatus TaxID=259542 RepID=A0AAV4CGB4_9GAST|nr:hypothetical protein PoB_005672400 [Plakobranchus ocellatus]